MSADNGYIIRKHPLGGFAAVHYFQSELEDYGTPPAAQTQEQFASIQDAWTWAQQDWTEYGVSIHSECWEETNASAS